VDQRKLAIMIDPATVCLFIPPELKKFKLDLFNRIGAAIEAKGGSVIRGDVAALAMLPRNVIPIVGCTPQLKPHIDGWRRCGGRSSTGTAATGCACSPPGCRAATTAACTAGTSMRSSCRRSATCLRTGSMPAGRRCGPGRNAAATSWSRIRPPTYARFHGCEDWTARTVEALARVTDRQIVVRDKESKRPLQVPISTAPTPGGARHPTPRSRR
jgi:hypothetical protein